VTERKQRKDDYQRALTAYTQAMKQFRSGSLAEAAELLTAFIENFGSESEITDRAKTYLTLARGSRSKKTADLKTIDDYLLDATLKINLGDYKGAVEVLEKAGNFKEKESRVNYLLAIAYCLAGESGTALDFLKKAIQKDGSLSVLARNEPDFEPLYEDKKFKLITRLI